MAPASGIWAPPGTCSSETSKNYMYSYETIIYQDKAE